MIHFLTGQILFSSVSPKYEHNLLSEIYDCHKYLKIPIDTLWNMRVRDRRFMIMKHNNDVQKEKGEGQGSHSTTDIDRFTDLTLSNQKRGVR